jgi:hypothetical protein
VFSVSDAVGDYRAIVDHVHKLWGYLALFAGGAAAFVASHNLHSASFAFQEALLRWGMLIGFAAVAVGNGVLIVKAQRDANRLAQAISEVCSREPPRPGLFEPEFRPHLVDLSGASGWTVGLAHAGIDLAVIVVILVFWFPA